MCEVDPWLRTKRLDLAPRKRRQFKVAKFTKSEAVNPIRFACSFTALGPILLRCYGQNLSSG